LENRKEIDCDLIGNATEKRPRTFTELLHITKLSRKTLSLRLKEMCKNDILVRNGRLYSLNGASKFSSDGGKSTEKVFRVFRDKRMRMGLMLIVLLAFSSASGYVLATFLTNTQPQKPVIIGSFVMTLEVGNVKDLYGWQAIVTFNSSELEVIKVVPGGFVGTKPANESITDVGFGEDIFLNEMDSSNNMLLLTGFLVGNVPGKDGPGRLATITFGYFVNNYKEPTLTLNSSHFETKLWNADGLQIPVENDIVTLFTLP
jgi:hypothetical protein